MIAFDYIVIGTGSAGAAATGRLSEDRAARLLLAVRAGTEIRTTTEAA